jgi:hypothetical protein
VIADNALLSGFATGQRPVGSALVREVCRDFRIDAEPAIAPQGVELLTTPVLAGTTTGAKKTGIEPPATRLLGIDRHVDRSGTETASRSEGGPAVEREEAVEREQMFGGMPPKRRRFLFFGGR